MLRGVGEGVSQYEGGRGGGVTLPPQKKCLIRVKSNYQYNIFSFPLGKIVQLPSKYSGNCNYWRDGKEWLVII